MKTSIIVALLVIFAGCSSTPPAPAPAANPPAAEGSSVELLTTYPSADYDNLGMVDFNFFRPGIRTPSVSDILPELKTKVRDAGGNAFIVRNQQPDRNEKRTLRVSAEILRVKK